MSRPVELSSLPIMTCAICVRCREVLTKDGKRTGRCIYGGPFSGYVKVSG